MIRALPYGFVYPVPRGWLAVGDFDPLLTPSPWVEEAGFSSDEIEEEKKKWRGFSIATRILAQKIRHQSQFRVPEFVIDVHQLNTGLNCHIFDEPCEEYHNLLTILRQPGFRRIDLALMVHGIEYENWRSFRNGYLARALGDAAELYYVSLRTDGWGNSSADCSDWTVSNLRMADIRTTGPGTFARPSIKVCTSRNVARWDTFDFLTIL